MWPCVYPCWQGRFLQTHKNSPFRAKGVVRGCCTVGSVGMTSPGDRGIKPRDKSRVSYNDFEQRLSNYCCTCISFPSPPTVTMAKSRKGRHQIPIELRCVIIACRLLYNSPYNEIERKIGVNANAARNIVNRALERAGNNDLHDVLACVGGADRSDRPRRSSENSETSHDTREATPKTTIDTEGASPSPEELPADKITYDAFKMFLSVVPESVPKKNQELEELRHHTIPEVLANRKKDGDAFLEKTEVQSLIEWKL